MTVAARRAPRPEPEAGERMRLITEREFALFQALILKDVGIYLAPAKKALLVHAQARQRLDFIARSDNAEAFQLYLQGKFFGERITQADTDKAIALYQQAIAVDPDYALAWTGLSRIHQLQAGFGFAPIDEGFERNSKAQKDSLRGRLAKLDAMFPDVAEGDDIWLIYAPGKGTTVKVKGAEKGVIEGKDFGFITPDDQKPGDKTGDGFNNVWRVAK